MRRCQSASALLALVVAAGACAPSGPASATPQVDDAWVRFTPGGMGAAYLTVTGGTHDDRLLSITADVAGHTELHTTTLNGGVMQMRPTAGLDVPAGARVVMEPGGSHVMLFDVSASPQVGSSVPLALEFEHAGVVEVDAEVRGP